MKANLTMQEAGKAVDEARRNAANKARDLKMKTKIFESAQDADIEAKAHVTEAEEVVRQLMRK